MDFRRGTAISAAFATKEITPFPEFADPSTIMPALRDALAERTAQAGVYAATLAVDPRTWQAVQFTLWDAPPAPDVAGIRYAVLHLSEPTP